MLSVSGTPGEPDACVLTEGVVALWFGTLVYLALSLLLLWLLRFVLVIIWRHGARAKLRLCRHG